MAEKVKTPGYIMYSGVCSQFKFDRTVGLVVIDDEARLTFAETLTY